MRTSIAVLAVAMVLAGCAAGGSSGKEHLKALLVAKFEREGAELFNEDSRIPEVDRPRAVHCILDAMLADMSNAQAKRLADMFEQKIPPEQDFVLYWVAPKDAGNADRAAQIESRAQQICPDLAGKLL
jgi:6-phosphogluconolactonase/glucosamine-6-phosphate isomerase/deaminase